VVEVAWLTDEEINRFKSDFRIVANFFKNKRLNENYIPDDPTVIKHVDEVLKLLSVMTGDNRYEINIDNAESRGVTMCTVAENLDKRGEMRGRLLGEKEGEMRGRLLGEKEGENKLATLITKLIADNKSDEIIKVTSDKDIREDYYKKYNIV
jgi:hypothetical protein